MHDLQRVHLLVAQFASGGHDKVDVAVPVEIADGEGPLQTGADEIVAQRRLHPLHQGMQHGIEFGVRG